MFWVRVPIAAGDYMSLLNLKNNSQNGLHNKRNEKIVAYLQRLTILTNKNKREIPADSHQEEEKSQPSSRLKQEGCFPLLNNRKP